MVQQEKGLNSHCICPACFATCAACMGTVQTPILRTDLLRRAEELGFDFEPDDKE